MPQSPSKQAPWDLTQFSQLPSAAPSYFPESHWQSEISSLSKVILVLGKARSLRVPNLGCRGTESLGWFDVLSKNFSGSVMNEWSCYHDEAANQQLFIMMALIIWVVSMEECRNLMQNVTQILCSTCSVTLHAMATHDGEQSLFPVLYTSAQTSTVWPPAPSCSPFTITSMVLVLLPFASQSLSLLTC